MTNPIRLASNLLVCSQLHVEDLAALNAVGIRTIVCNRPDGEAPDQPSNQEIADAARQRNMTFTHLPVTPKMQLHADDSERFNDVLESSRGEVVAYCRTGKRSVTMWALSQRGRMPAKEIIRAAAQSGFDISNLADRLAPDVPLIMTAEPGCSVR